MKAKWLRIIGWLTVPLLPVAATAQGTSACSESGNDDAPYQCSDFLTDLEFDCNDSLVVSEAVDSDVWITTWHSDDLIYSSWGDGEGFLSGDTHFSGVNENNDTTYGIGAITGTPVWDNKNSAGAWTWSDLEQWRDYTDASSRGGKIDALVGVTPRGGVPAMLYGILNPQGRPGKDPSHFIYWDPVGDAGTDINRCSQELTTAASPYQPVAIVQFNSGHTVPSSGFDNPADDDYLYILMDEYLGENGNDEAILARVAIPTGDASDICTTTVEYVTGIDASNVPAWNSNVNDAIFTFADTNYVSPSSSALVYVEDLDRFILSMNHKFNGASDSDGVDFGAIGFFAAETPWGPWRTVRYFHDGGDLCGFGFNGAERGLGFHMPVKWFHDSGRRFYGLTSTKAASTCWNNTTCDAFHMVQGEFTINDSVQSGQGGGRRGPTSHPLRPLPGVGGSAGSQ